MLPRVLEMPQVRPALYTMCIPCVGQRGPRDRHPDAAAGYGDAAGEARFVYHVYTLCIPCVYHVWGSGDLETAIPMLPRVLEMPQ
eukprot:9495163-Pyramimonas_sp.AAC.1